MPTASERAAPAASAASAAAPAEANDAAHSPEGGLERGRDDAVDAEHARADEVRSRLAPSEGRALGTLAVLAAIAILWVLLPVGIGVLLGTLLAFVAYKPYRKLVRRTRKPAPAAALLTAIATVAVAGTLGTLAFLLILKGLSVVSTLPQSFAPGGPASTLVQQLAKPLAAVHMTPEYLADRARRALGDAASSLAGWAAQFLGLVFDGMLALLFTAMTMYFILRHWAELARRAEHLMPLNPHHTRRLMRELQRLGRQVVIGNFATALAQGAIAWIGYLVARVPEAALLGAVTAVASLVPAFGTMLVWVPVGVLLLSTGHAGAGAFELSWGALVVVGFSDYVVRPRLVGRDESMSTWMAFVALFGGLKVFGFVGVLVGPLVVGMALAVLKVHERTRRFRLALPHRPAAR